MFNNHYIQYISQKRFETDYSISQYLGCGGKGQHTFHTFLPGLNSRTACVCVFVEESHPAEGPLAARTGVLLVLQVSLQMGPQVGLVCKGPGTVGAGKGLLPGVGPHVALQQPGPGKGLSTLRTLAGQSVGSDMHLECRLGVVGLEAVRARKVLLNLICGVKLLMLQVARLRTERLVAWLAGSHWTGVG